MEEGRSSEIGVKGRGRCKEIKAERMLAAIKSTSRQGTEAPRTHHSKPQSCRHSRGARQDTLPSSRWQEHTCREAPLPTHTDKAGRRSRRCTRHTSSCPCDSTACPRNRRAKCNRYLRYSSPRRPRRQDRKTSSTEDSPPSTSNSTSMTRGKMLRHCPWREGESLQEQQ